MHGEFLRLTDDKPEVSEAADLVEQGRWREADLDEKDRRMLEYAEAITVAPASIEERHIQGLREVGFSDRDIFDIANTAATFNYVTRVADASGHRRDDDDWLPKPGQPLPMTD